MVTITEGRQKIIKANSFLAWLPDFTWGRAGRWFGCRDCPFIHTIAMPVLWLYFSNCQRLITLSVDILFCFNFSSPSFLFWGKVRYKRFFSVFGIYLSLSPTPHHPIWKHKLHYLKVLYNLSFWCCFFKTCPGRRNVKLMNSYCWVAQWRSQYPSFYSSLICLCFLLFIA